MHCLWKRIAVSPGVILDMMVLAPSYSRVDIEGLKVLCLCGQLVSVTLSENKK